MATLWITEHKGYTPTAHGDMVPISSLEDVTTQKFTVSGTSAQSSALASTTKMVELYADVNMHIKSDTNPTATTTHRIIPAGTPVFYSVDQGGGKIAARTLA